MSLPAATLSEHASTWFWLTPSDWETALKSSASAFWLCTSAAWIWSQSTNCTLPATPSGRRPGQQPPALSPAPPLSPPASSSSRPLCPLDRFAPLPHTHPYIYHLASSSPPLNNYYVLYDAAYHSNYVFL